MNDDLEDLLFERELRTLRPAAVSSRLEDRISGSITDPAPPRPRAGWWQRLGFERPMAALGWGLAAPAVAVAITLMVVRIDALTQIPASSTRHAAGSGESAAGGPRISSFKEARTVKAANVLNGTFDEGVVSDGDDRLVRRVRYRSTDHVQWHNPRTGAHWEISYPREDVVLVPVNAE